MQDRGRLLLFSSAPKSDESLLGYLLRLTGLNRLDTLSWMLQKAQIKSFVQTNVSFVFDPSINLLPLAELTGVDLVELSALFYKPIDPEKAMGDYFMFGCTVPQYMIRVRQPKVCPACLQEAQYAHRLWELSPVTACPFHRCMLLDECPSCAKRISWSRSKVSCCQCGCDWRNYEARRVEESELGVSTQIYLQCKLLTSRGTPRQQTYNSPIYNIDLKSFLSALFFIAGQYVGVVDTKGKHLAPSIRNVEIHLLLCKALAAFDKWPDNYFAFLDWRKEQARETQSAGGLRNEFSGYKSALYTQLASSQLDFMRSAFERYLSARWDGGYTAHLKRLDQTARMNGKYASRREAKSILKVGVQGVDGLINAGRLNAVIRHRAGGRMILIERRCLQEFKRELESSLYLKQVERVLGVSRERVMELVGAALLSPLRGPNIDGCGDWKFSKREVECLLAQAMGKTRVANNGAGNTVGFLMAFRTLTRVNVGMAQFLRAILDDEVTPCGKTTKPGLAALLFPKAEVSNYASKQRRKQVGETYSVIEAAVLLG